MDYLEILNLVGFVVGIFGIAIAAYQMTQDSKALRKMAQLLILQAVILYRATSYENKVELAASVQQRNLWSEFLSTARTVYSDKAWIKLLIDLKELIDEPTEE